VAISANPSADGGGRGQPATTWHLTRIAYGDRPGWTGDRRFDKTFRLAAP